MSGPWKDTLLEPIERILDTQKCVHFTFSDGGQLLVLGDASLYRQVGCSLETLAVRNLKAAKTQVLSKTSQSVANARQEGRELAELQWMLAYRLSNGELLGDLQPTDVFTMTRWPNFSRLPHTGNSLRIAALVSQRPTSVPIVARMLRIPLQDVRQFYTAASVSGYATAVNKGTTPVAIKPHKQQSVISALLSKLRRVSTDAA